jgi:antitoxin component of MazEF toxin-antitoxin module
VKKTLTRQGNSKALIIDRPLLDLLHIDREVEISTNGHSLLITPVAAGVDEDVLARLDRIEHDFAPMFKRLAE